MTPNKKMVWSDDHEGWFCYSPNGVFYMTDEALTELRSHPEVVASIKRKRNQERRSTTEYANIHIDLIRFGRLS